MPDNLKRSLSYSLVAGGNAIVLFGVLFWKWQVFDVLYLYWLENVILGVVTIVRMLLSGARRHIIFLVGAVFCCVFFLFHYGMFTMVHGIFLVAFFQPDALAATSGDEDAFLLPLMMLLLPSMQSMGGFLYLFFGVLLIELVHGVLAVINDRRKKTDITTIMHSPYGRIIVLHLTILFGGALFMLLQAPAPAVALFVVFKTAYDFKLLRSADEKPKDGPFKIIEKRLRRNVVE